MKRIVTLLLAAGLVFGAHTGAQAVDFKTKGTWDFNFEWLEGTDFNKNNTSKDDTFAGKQRFRTQIDVIASEALSGTVYFEIGDTIWGSKDGALGSDGKSIEVKRSYIDWIVPQTDLKVRMGIQGLALPGFVAGSPVLDDDVAALTLSYSFNDNVAATVFWARPYDTGAAIYNNQTLETTSFDELDIFGLVVPITLDGMKIVPWGMYSSIGKNINGSSSDYNQSSWQQAAYGLRPDFDNGKKYPQNGQTFDKGTDAWWGGLSYQLTMFDPLKFSVDGVYGSVKGDNEEWDRSGWLAIAQLDYKLSMFTPGIFGWYASGDDNNRTNGSEQMPYISPDFGPTSFGFDKYAASIATDSILSVSGAGTWGVGLQAAKISFLENLSHVLRVAYIEGTNDQEMAKYIIGTNLNKPNSPVNSYNGVYMTEKDHAIEVNFDTTYKIYENLTLLAELGYINLNMDEDVWHQKFDNAWKAGINFQYAF